MSSKIKTITLSYPHVMFDNNGEQRWKVQRVTDSIEFTPGTYLPKTTVDELCESSQWKVTVVPVPK